MHDKRPEHTQEHYGFKEGAREFPLMVVLSFVYVCNARCPNCPYNHSTIRRDYKDALFMPEDLFKKIADECAPFGTYLRVSGGGEPMLHPKAEELILYAKAKGARVGLITNGSFFPGQSLENLIHAGIDVIEFSADAGDEPSYQKVRPGLEWNTLNRNVRTAVDIRNRVGSGTRIIVSVINQQDVDVKAAEAYWTPIADKVQIRKYLTWGYNPDHSADASPYLPPEERIPCPWLFERLNIDSLGNVTLCGEDIAFAEKFANIRDRSIQEIWNGKEFSEFRKKHLERRGHEIPICSRCPDWQYRSWQYNYWKILKDADKTRNERPGGAGA